MSAVLESVTDDSFESVVMQSDVPVLVDYWASWCAPCRQLAPILESITQDYEHKLKVIKLDVEHNKNTATKYNVRGIPTLMLFKEGKVIATHIGGNLSKSQLTTFVDSNL